MIATHSNWRDVQRSYEHSYIKIKGFGDKLFFVGRVTSEMMSGHDSEDTGFELWLGDDQPFEIDYVLPHHAVFQHKTNAVELRRMPSRQYRRGLHQDNTRIKDVVTGTGMDLGFTVLESFVCKQQYPSLKEAISLPNRSTALTSRMSYGNKDATLYMDSVAIAKVVDDTIKVSRSIFFKEVLYYVNTTGQQFKVVV